ncbi:hypothetical protein BD0141_08900 [Helicobacter pylori]
MDIEKISKISSMLHKKAKQLHALKNINEPKNPNDLIILEDLIALLDFKIEFKECKELRFKEQEEITTKQKQAKEILEKIPDQQDKEIQKISKELSKLLQEPLTNDNFDGISHSYSVIISQLKQHKEQTTHLLNKYNKEQEEITTKQKQAKEILEKIPDQQDKEIQKISKELSKLLQEPLTNDNFDGISHSYSVIISQLKQHKEQTTHLLNKYNNDLSYAITHKRLHKHLMEQNLSNPAGIFTLLSELKKAIDERISKRQEILEDKDYLENAIKVELREVFKKNPSLKDLEKETELIAQTLFNNLTQNHHQGNLHA